MGPHLGNMIVKFNSCTSTRSRQVSTSRPLLRFGAAPCARLAALGSKLLYVDTTPFMPRRLLNDTVVEDMNAIAREVVAPYVAAPVVSLYEEVTRTCGQVYTDCPICRLHPCKFHYDDEGENAQAAIVAAAIQAVLADKDSEI